MGGSFGSEAAAVAAPKLQRTRRMVMSVMSAAGRILTQVSEKLSVFVRPAKISDAAVLIELNIAYRWLFNFLFMNYSVIINGFLPDVT